MVNTQKSPLQNAWQSKLVWRVAVALFIVVLLVQSVFAVLSISHLRQNRLDELRTLGFYSLMPFMAGANLNPEYPPLSSKAIERLMQTTPIEGISYYTKTGKFVGNAGASIDLKPQFNDVQYSGMHKVMSYNSDEKIYEIIYPPQEFGISHYVIVRMDAFMVEEEVSQAIKMQFVTVLLLSIIVTIVLVLLLVKWFLEPTLYLYQRLMLAVKTPETPPKIDKKYYDHSEIGRAIFAADTLMKNNANGLKQMQAMAESEVNRLAYYDTLTGLPNRTYFIKMLKDNLAGNEDYFMDRYAVLTMDVDHFKDINDTMGHAVGDEVLKAFAKRLQETAPHNAIIARSGEDEFAVMLPINGDIVEAESRASEIIEAFRSESIIVMDEQFQVRCSIGIAVSPEDGDAPEDVMKCADIALNKAKADGRDCSVRYDGTYTEDIQRRFQILRDLRTALDNNELELYFQPQINLKTQKIIGAEALIRWWKQGPNGIGGHFVSPVDFIPVAEQSGLILPLGDWILEKACQTAQKWTQDGMGDLSIAVNVSGHQFLQKDMVHKIERMMIEYGVKSHQLEVEVTESVFMEDTDHSIKMLKDIQSMGVSIAIDDFGTGYSSLSYLQRFPMDKLKIDRSFIRHMDEQHDNLVLTKTIIALCKTMGLKVVAEGVESKAEEGILIDEGCQIAQGFRYAAPLPEAKFKKFVAEYNGALDYFD